MPLKLWMTGFQSSLCVIGSIGDGAAVTLGAVVGLAVGGGADAQAAAHTRKILVRKNRFMFTGEKMSPVQYLAVGNYACPRPAKQVASRAAKLYSLSGR